MKLSVLFALSLSFISTFIFAEKRRVLFIGNSYTYTNDLPNVLRQLALSLNDTLEIDSYAQGGATFNALSNNANAIAKIQLGNWDYVVLQGQSQEPAFPPSQVETDTYPYAKKLDSIVHVYNPCAETLFFMTWGRKNGDAANCAAYPPICTYEGMQQRLRESYMEMTQNNHATCVPVGVAWASFRTQFPNVELYSPDESHPAANGTYLAACTFYSTIYQKSSVGATFIINGMIQSDAQNIQTIVSNTVLDSIENWQQFGNLPNANFTATNNQNQFSFTNQSLRATNYEWNFGDGSPLTNIQNPQHTYTTQGTYTVGLIASNNCNKYSIKKKTIQVTGTPNEVYEFTQTVPAQLFYQNGIITFLNPIQNIIIMNLNGQVMFTLNHLNATQTLDCRSLSKGFYFYTLQTSEKKTIRGKIVIQ